MITYKNTVVSSNTTIENTLNPMHIYGTSMIHDLYVIFNSPEKGN